MIRLHYQLCGTNDRIYAPLKILNFNNSANSKLIEEYEVILTNWNK